jgi:C4-dicarboxylate-specific signal transduction histidine kinase
MRVQEIIVEMRQPKPSKRQAQSSRGLNTYKDGERADSTYTSYRLGMAVAGSNGKDPIEMDGKSWAGKNKTTHPYTEEEQEMLKQAYKAVGAKYKDLNHGDMRSLEMDSINKTSPVAKRKTNKYGV